MTQKIISRAREHAAIVGDAATLAVSDTQAALVLADRLNDDFAYGLLRETIPEILGTYASVVGTIDVTYYNSLREAAGITSAYSALTASVNWQEVAEPIAGFAIARTIQRTPLDATIAIIGGAVSSELFNYSRLNVIQNSQSDPSQVTYKRITRPKACDFCLYMATGFEGDGSNEQYKNFHQSCGCVDVPVFSTQTFQEPQYYEEFKGFTQEARSRIEANRQAARAADPGLRNKEFFAKYPETALTTKNIVKEIRKVRLGE